MIDLLEEKVKIKNYANNIMYRAFGKNDNPTFSDYEEFLKSRCFPETRDKLKLVLEDLNLPFYDPFLIIKKTEGRMAEDDFWIRIFEQDIVTNDRQSSKGNQLKWKNKDIWYKADSIGYEGLTEYVISNLLLKSTLKKDEFVLYNPVQIKYKTKKFNGVSSVNFLKENYKIVTLERLFQMYYGKSLHTSLWTIREPEVSNVLW